MLGVAFRLLRRRALAEEAVHDAFVQIWRRADSFDRTRGPARAWIYAILRHRALNIRRDEARTELAEDLEPMHLSSDDESAESIVMRLRSKRLAPLPGTPRAGTPPGDRARLSGGPEPPGIGRTAPRAGRDGEVLDPAFPSRAEGLSGMTRDERDRLAAEHVLGLLEGAEAAQADELLRHDGTETAVARWRDRLAELDEQTSPIAAGEALWRRSRPIWMKPGFPCLSPPRLATGAPSGPYATFGKASHSGALPG